MGSPAALDLAEIDPRIWRVKSGNTIYGPYTFGQMRQFVVEGRVAQHTEIAEGVGSFQPASQTVSLHGIFAALSQEDDDSEAGDLTNMLVVLKPAGTSKALLLALAKLGTFVEVWPGAVLLKTPLRVAKVQAALNEAAHGGDQALIVDAGANRIAWVGLAPGQDATLRELWDTPSSVDKALA